MLTTPRLHHFVSRRRSCLRPGVFAEPIPQLRLRNGEGRQPFLAQLDPAERSEQGERLIRSDNAVADVLPKRGEALKEDVVGKGECRHRLSAYDKNLGRSFLVEVDPFYECRLVPFPQAAQRFGDLELGTSVNRLLLRKLVVAGDSSLVLIEGG